MFRGQHQHAIDGKGRTSLPARFREVLATLTDSRLIVTTGLDPCLVAYSMESWAAFEQALKSKPSFNRSVKAIRRIYFSAATECDVDKLGRILLPSYLRAHARLENDVLWCGSGDFIELWNPEDFAAQRHRLLESPESRAAIEDELSELGL